MIQNESVDELLTVLNESEEHTDLEAKSLRDDKMRSILETVCSFSNEPNLEGGTILAGIAESRKEEGPRFVVEHIDDLDHAQADLATQCKTALVFVREVRAIDNQTYRQMAGCDTLKASQDLRKLRDCGLLRQKGSGVSTYYVPSWEKLADESLVDKGSSLVDNGLSLVDKGSILVDKGSILVDCERHSAALKRLRKRMSYSEISSIICDLCRDKYLTKEQLAKLLNRNEGYLKTILVRMIDDKLLIHKYPEMKNHPGQAYMAAKGEGARGNKAEAEE